MSDVGTLHVLDFNGGYLASFRSHHGGSPGFMLPKIADWRATHPTAPIRDLIRWALANSDLALEIIPAGRTERGHKTHAYRVSPLADLRDDGTVPTIRVGITRHQDTDFDESVRAIDGNEALFAAAAAELNDMADNCERIAARQEWDDKTRDQLGYDPAPLRREAARFTTLAEAPQPILALALDLTL